LSALRVPYLTPLGAALLLAVIVATIRSWADYHIYWHLANGRLMVEQGRFPSPDVFSWSAAGAPYLAYSTPFDQAFFLLWRTGGVRAVALAAAGLYAAAMLPYTLLIARLRVRPLAEASMLLVIACAMGPYRGARPHVVAFALFGLIAWLLARPFGSRQALVIGGALGLWALVHGTFVLGFAAIAATIITWVAQRDWSAVAWTVLALVIGVAISLLSPHGMALWLAPLHTASSSIQTVNADWQGLRPLSSDGAAAAVILLTALGLGVWRVTDARTMAALLLVLPSIQVARFSPFVMPLLAVLVLERLVDRLPFLSLDTHSPLAITLNTRRVRITTWLALVAGGAAMLPLAPNELEAASLPAVRSLPVLAVDKLLACGAPAPVWNDYNWGGYLLWRGEGQYTVGMDGRAETLYTETIINRYLHVMGQKAGWQADVQNSPARYALLPPGGPAVDQLPGWRLAYMDDVASLAVRDSAVWRCGSVAARHP